MFFWNVLLYLILGATTVASLGYLVWLGLHQILKW